MATKGGKIDFQVGFNVDKTGLSEMQSSFQKIISLAEQPGNELNEGLQKAAHTASIVSDILTRTFNANLGSLNVSKFNQELQKSGLSLKEVQSHLENIGANGSSAYNRLTQAVLRTNLQVKQTSKILDEMFTTLKNTIRYGISSSIVNNLGNSIQQAFNYSKNLDTSLNDIRIVTDKSADSMAKFAQEANEAAKSMGASTLDYTNAALIYYQQGLSDAEVAARAETTIKAANVTGQTGEEVSEQLTAVWNGYKVTAEETELYVDKLAAVAATTAADLEELSVGMSKVASAANAMGVDFDDLNAQIATIVSVTRQAPESVGTALKTIYARLGDLKVDGVDEFGVSLGEVSEQLVQMGIQILDQNGDLRDMSSVIAEVAEKWNGWTQAQRQAAAVAMAGKRQYNNLIALFDNWDMYTEALNTSTEAVGTLQHQQDIYMESTAAKLKTLKAAWQGLYDDAINEDEINTGIEALTNLVEVFDNFISSFGGGTKAILAFGSIVANVFNKQIAGAINTTYQNIIGYQNNLQNITAKLDALKTGLILSSGDEAQDIAIEKSLDKEFIIAEQIEQVRKGLTDQEYNELMILEQEVGKLTEQKVLQEESIKAQIQGTALEQESANILSQTLNEYKQYASEQKQNYNNTINKVKNIDIQYQKVETKVKHIREELTNLGIPQEKINKLCSTNITQQDTLNQKVKAIEIYLKEQINLLDQIGQKKQNIVNLDDQSAEKIQEISNKIAQAGANMSISNVVTSITSGLSGIATAWMGVSSLIDTISNKNISVGDKITQSFMSLSMVIPSLISSFSKLNSVFGVTETASELLSIQNDKNILTQNALAITNKLLNGTFKEQDKELLINALLKTGVEKAGKKLTKQNLEELTTTELLNLAYQQQIVLGKKIIAQKISNFVTSGAGKIAIALTAIVTIIAIVKKAYDKYIEKIKENNEEIIKNAKEIEEQIKAHEDLYNSYNKLFKQYEKDKKVTNELYENALKLAEAYDIQGGRVLALGEYYDTLGKKAEEARIKELNTKITTAESAAQSAGENAILDAKKGSRGFKHGDTYTFYEHLHNDKDRIAAVEAAGLSVDSSGGFSKDIDYTNPKAVKEWMDQVDQMVEYYKENVDEEIRKTDYFYKDLIAEQSELSKNRADLIDQLTLQYSGMIEKAILEQKNLDNGIKLTEETTTLELAQLKESIRDSLDIPEEDFEKIFNNYLKNISSINDAYNKLEIAEQIKEQSKDGTQQSLKEIIGEIEDFNDKQLAFLEVHLNTAILSDDLGKWINDNQDVLNVLNEYGTSTSFKNILTNYDEKEGFTEEQKTSLYNNDNMKSYLPSEQGFNAMDEGDQLNSVTLAWIESTKAIVEHKKEALDTLNEEEKATKELLDAKAKEAEENEAKISAEIEGNEKLEDKLFEIIALSQKLTNEDAKLSKEEKQLLKDIESKTNLNKDDLKVYGETQNKVDKLEDAYHDYGNMIDEITNLTENHKENAEKLNQVMSKQSSVMDSIQSNYKSLIDITDNYNKTHAFTIDNVQQLMTMDDQYVAALQIEGNQLSINEQYFQALTIAKLNDLKETALIEMQEKLLALAQEESAKAADENTASQIQQKIAVTEGIEAAKEGAAAWREYATAQREAAGVSGSEYDAKAKEITDATYNRIKAAESAITEIGKGGKSMRSAMGASSKSGGSSKDKDKELKKLEEEFDRYWEIHKALDQIDRDLKRIDKDQENLYGKELIRSLKQENELLANQSQLYEQLYAAQEQEAAELRGTLANSGVAFDASGAVLNYAEATAAALKEYNDAITAYNAGKLDDAALKIHEQKFEQFKKDLERYDTLFYTEMQDTMDKIDDLHRQTLANNLKAWEVEIQLKLDFKELERDWNDFIKEVTSDFQKVFKDLRVEAKNMLKDATTYVGSEGTINTIIGAVHDVTGEIDKLMGGGSSDMFESVSQAQEKLKELNDQLLDSGKALHDLWMEAWDNYLEGIDQVSDAFDDLLDRYERINDELNFQSKLIELLYGEEAYKLMSKYYEGMEKNTAAQVESVKQQVDMWKQLFDASGATMDNQLNWNEDQKKYYEQWIEAQEKLNDLVLEYIELLKKDYLNTISDVMKELEKYVTGSNLDSINTQWERIAANADKYYDSVEGAYYIQTLANKIDQSIADADGLKAQQKLMALREKEIDYLREKETLTEYDIKAAELRYQIALKEIALEDAQNNKTGMKLTRNEQGNWSYQYVADETDVATKQQELLDAYNNLYQLASDAYEANLETLQELQEKYLESAKTIYEDDTLTEEERQAKLLELREWYLEQYRLLSEENQLYRNDLASSGAALLLEIYEQDQEAYESMTEHERELVDALINANIDDYMELEDRLKDNYQEIGDKAKEVMSETRADWTSGAQTIADLWNKDGGWSVKTQVVKAYDAIEEANRKYKEAVDWCAAAVERNFGEEGIVGAIQNAEYETDALRDKTVELVNTSIPYLQELQANVIEIGNAWKSVQNEIMAAIGLIDEYLRKVGEANEAEARAAEIANQPTAPTNSDSGGSSKGSKGGASSSSSYYTDPYGVSGTRMQDGHIIGVVGYDPTANLNYTKLPTKTSYSSTSSSVSSGSMNVNEMRKKIFNGASGGYTGSWGADGRLAILHQKELVLNADDTKNFLSGINTIRTLSSSVGGSIQNAVLKAVANTALSLGSIKANGVMGNIANNNSSTDNVFNITAEFPNANSVDDIREAILSLPNIASQYANSTLK